MLSITTAHGQSSDADTIRRLEEENAALRKQLATLQSQPAAPATSPATAEPAAPAAAAPASTGPVAPTASANAGTVASKTDDGTLVLSPFEVRTDKDYGYLKTNSATATRIGMEIQKVPMAVSVLSSDFIRDTNMRDITGLLTYTASASGDPRFAMTRPSNEATPQGGFTLRGFPVNVILRNGVLLYSTKTNVDNVDRVEIVKGPAAVFFGQGYPGGVINFVTKRPEFSHLPTTLSYTFGADNMNRGTVDTNQVFSDKAAMRVVGGWENSNGQREFEFTKRFDITPSLTLVPFSNGKVKITAETIYLKERYNQNAFSWLFPSGWFQSYANPESKLMQAAGLNPTDPASVGKYRTRIFNNLGAWIADMRKANNDPLMPLYTNVASGAYYTDLSGHRVHDEHFNFTNRGAYVDNEQTTTDITVDAAPFSWLDARYVFTTDNTTFNDIEGLNYPNADGITFNAAYGGNGSGYYRKTKNHQLDLVVKFKTGPIKHKLLGGYVLQNYLQQYWSPATNTTPFYAFVPGFNYPTVNTGPGSLPNNGLNTGWNVPVNQVLHDRFGNVLTAPQVYSQWDPSAQVQPPVNKIFPLNRNLLDGYPTQYNDWYVNYQASMMDDRLNVLAGFRQETRRDSGQFLTANYPWFSPGPYAFTDQTDFPPSVYNYSPSYAATNFMKQTGNSWMGGASFEIVKGVNLYASVSQTFRFNSRTPLGGYDQVAFPTLAQNMLNASGGSFTYKFQDGSTRVIHSVAEAVQAVHDAGADELAKNEEGINYEIGAKTSLNDNRLVSTVSIFRSERRNQLTEDPQHQTDDVFNYNPLIGGARNFRWRSNAARNRIEGAEFEVIWTPIRNFQSVTNGSWLWTAKTIADPSIPKTAANYQIYFGNRIENVPEYKFTTFNKYTFDSGAVRGLSVGLGARYTSKEIISRSVDWNPERGGFTAGNYVVFDGTLSYPWEIFGYRLSSQFGVYNLTDQKYFDGGYVPGPRRTWLLTNTLSF
ncbi:MAG TPA: TonB-dependent receptor [Opitutaceae bacterium]|nr:TonB-dependent receptor [Opitutaceae bacterium]